MYFPAAIREYVEELPSVTGCEESFAGLSALFVSSLVASNCKITVKNDFVLGLNLYCCIVADKGSAKSIAVKKMKNPLGEISSLQWNNYNSDYECWFRSYKNAKQEDKENLENIEPKKPRTFFVTGGTIEGIRRSIESNQRGGFPSNVGVIRDELNGFFESMNQYKGKGDDKEIYLQLYDGDDIHISNKNEIISIKDPSVSIIGTIQPNVFKSAFAGNVENGLLDRFIFAMSNGSDQEIDPFTSIDPEITEMYNNKIVRLIDNKERMFIIPEDCKDKGREVYKWLKSKDKIHGLGASPKWWVHYFKMVGLLAYIHEIDVNNDIMEKGFKLLEFFVTQFIEGSNNLKRNNVHLLKDKVLEMIKERGQVSWTEAFTEFRKKEDLRTALDSLCDDGIVSYKDMKTKGRSKRIYMLDI